MKRLRIFSFLLLLLFVAFFYGCRNNTADSVKNPVDLFIPEDLELTLWAESPLLNNPTNMDVDAKGRLWVTEAVNYRNFNNDSTRFLHHSQGDRVVILQDRDNNGKADTAITYVQDRDLLSPVGIAVFGNQVVVSCSPNLIIYTDLDGDDHPDKKEIFLTGFGGLDHDHSLHAVYGGPDGNWYFNTGNAGPHHVTDHAGWTLNSGSVYTGGTPYSKENHGNQRSDDGKVYVGGLALRIGADGRGLKVLGHNFRNSYEVFPDSYGNLWQNDNDDQVVACRTSWLMEGGNAGYFSTDGTRYWQSDQRPGQDIFTAHWHQDDPGVMPAGDRSGAGAPTGIVRIETDELGAGYRGMLLSADAGRNVVFGYSPTPEKSGYSLGKRTNIFTSISTDNEGYVWNDSSSNAKKENWFRPSDVTIGTDGAIYIADWYDPVVGGHQMQDSAAYGRIYRITPKNRKLVNPSLDMATLKGQLDAFLSPAINVRYSAARLLEKGGQPAITAVSALLNDKNPFVRARATWLLSRMGAEGVEAMKKSLQDPDPQIRATAFRALRQQSKDLGPLLETLIHDSAAFVRRELILGLAALPAAQQKALTLQLARKYDGNDRWYLETLGSAMDNDPEYWFTILKDSLFTGSTPSAWGSAMASLTWRLHPVAALPDLEKRVKDSSLPAEARLLALRTIAFTNHINAAKLMLSLSSSLHGSLREEAGYWLGFRKENDWYAYLPWNKLNLDTYKENKLARMKVNWQMVTDKRQSDYERNARLDELLIDSTGGQLLLDQLADKKVPDEFLKKIGTRIFDNPDPGVRLQATAYFTAPAADNSLSPDKILALRGDAKAGLTIFKQHCIACHKVGDSGAQIGPELTGISKKLDAPALLQAILNPDAAIVFGYEPLLVTEKNGESHFGFLLSENEQLLVLKDLSGTRISIDKKNITVRKKQDHSLMPSAASMKLQEADLANVLAFLKGK